MRTGLYKSDKTTEIYFDEASPVIDIYTYNTDLRKRLLKFASEHPESYRQTDDDGQGRLAFEVEKGRLSFRLTAPNNEERREAASVIASRARLLRFTK